MGAGSREGECVERDRTRHGRIWIRLLSFWQGTVSWSASEADKGPNGHSMQAERAEEKKAWCTHSYPRIVNTQLDAAGGPVHFASFCCSHPIPDQTRFLDCSKSHLLFYHRSEHRPISNSISHPSSISTTTASLNSLGFLHHHYQSGSGSP